MEFLKNLLWGTNSASNKGTWTSSCLETLICKVLVLIDWHFICLGGPGENGWNHCQVFRQGIESILIELNDQILGRLASFNCTEQLYFEKEYR